MAVIVSFLVACTIIEMKQQSLDADNKLGHPIINTLAMFSLRKSISSILSTEVKKGTLPALDGIRSLSMISLVLFHQCYLSTDGAMVNTLDFVEVNTDIFVCLCVACFCMLFMRRIDSVHTAI